jgi:hypothetical protein
MKGTGGAPKLGVAGFGAVVRNDVDTLRKEKGLQLMNPLRLEGSWHNDEVGETLDAVAPTEIWALSYNKLNELQYVDPSQKKAQNCLRMIGGSSESDC